MIRGRLSMPFVQAMSGGLSTASLYVCQMARTGATNIVQIYHRAGIAAPETEDPAR